jgi:cytochrome c oxidase subunit I
MATTLTRPGVAAPVEAAPRETEAPPSYRGFMSWLTTVDHKRIGILYGVTAFIFFIVGGIEALMIRMQLATPNAQFVSPDAYNQLFTMHGTTMIFLFVMPMSVAFFNYIVPLQIGARDVAFPRLNAFSYWTFLFGGIFMNLSFFFGGMPDGGWYGYAPLTTRAYSPGERIDFWMLSLQILGVASMAGAFNFAVTIINMRAPGMSLMRMPIFTWNTLITSFLLIFAFPAITVALLLLMFDRMFGTNFYYVPNGGDPLLWQHLFWIFGHPEVYILILPAFGMVSEILPVFARKPLFGYPFVVYATVAIGFIGFGVWSHHMFTTGLGPIANSFTMLIAVPTGVKILNWTSTMYGGSIRFTTAMMFAIALVSMFTIGGLSGVMHAVVPVDRHHNDSYFVIAHFHYVLFGGAVFALFGGIYYWWPKITARLLDERLGKLNFWLMFVGFNLTFGPMHFLGVDGMPRRVYTYSPEQGWAMWNMVVTIGAFILTAGILVFMYNALVTMLKPRTAGADPWDAATLEWSIPSPPPVYNFLVEPVVHSRDPLWAAKGRHQAVEAHENVATISLGGAEVGHAKVEEDVPDEERTARQAERAGIGTVVDAATHDHAGDGHGANGHGDGHGIHLPNPSFFPMITAFGLTIMMAGFIFGIGFTIAGLLYLLVGIGGWALEPTG